MSCRVQWCPSPPLWTVDTLLSQLSLDCCWCSKGRNLSSGQSAARTGCDHGGGSDVGAYPAEQDLLPQGSGVHRVLECVAYGGGWVVLRPGVKLSTGAMAPKPSRRSTPRSAATCVPPGASWHGCELQSDLQMTATCAGLGGPRGGQAMNQRQLPLVLGLGILG